MLLSTERQEYQTDPVTMEEVWGGKAKRSIARESSKAGGRSLLRLGKTKRRLLLPYEREVLSRVGKKRGQK